MTTVLRKILALTSTIILLERSCSDDKSFRTLHYLATKTFNLQTNILGQFTKTKRLVNHYEGLYTDEEELVLDRIIKILKSETGIEFALIDNSRPPRRQKFDELTLRIANSWGVGEKGKDNGILIGISRGHRKIKVNNGIGIEKTYN